MSTCANTGLAVENERLRELLRQVSALMHKWDGGMDEMDGPEYFDAVEEWEKLLPVIDADLARTDALVPSLTTSAQATAKVLAAARSFMSLTERWRRDTPTNEFDSLPTDDMYEAIVAAERALREAIREEQEGK